MKSLPLLMAMLLAFNASAKENIVVHGVIYSTPSKSIAVVSVDKSQPTVVRKGEKVGNLLIDKIELDGVVINGEYHPVVVGKPAAMPMPAPVETPQLFESSAGRPNNNDRFRELLEKSRAKN
jgi:type II secretory pathway component PulC